MNETFDAAPAAAVLAEHWHRGTLIDALPPALRPRTLAEGYDVQDRLIAALGEPVVGWKLGVGSALQKRQNGIGRSVAGRVLAPALQRPGATVAWSGAGPVTIEVEIAYVLACDVTPDEPPPRLEALIGEVRLTVELVRSRFVDRRAVGWASFAADNAACHALVVGDALDAAALLALPPSLVVLVDGQERVRSLTGDDLTDPAEALADLIAIAGERGMTLRAGSIVTTGTLSRPFDVEAPGAEIEARHANGSLSFRLAAAGGRP